MRADLEGFSEAVTAPPPSRNPGNLQRGTSSSLGRRSASSSPAQDGSGCVVSGKDAGHSSSISPVDLMSRHANGEGMRNRLVMRISIASGIAKYSLEKDHDEVVAHREIGIPTAVGKNRLGERVGQLRGVIVGRLEVEVGPDCRLRVSGGGRNVLSTELGHSEIWDGQGCTDPEALQEDPTRQHGRHYRLSSRAGKHLASPFGKRPSCGTHAVADRRILAVNATAAVRSVRSAS